MPSTEADAAAPVRLTGGCHCGKLEVTFESRQQPAGFALRACACAFCRSHAARTVSDPEGRVTFEVSDPGQLSRYRFALGTAEFLVCRTCGVYVGALTAEDGAAFAIVNVNALAARAAFAQPAVAVSYDRETADERRARRRARWTPAQLVERAAAGGAA